MSVPVAATAISLSDLAFASASARTGILLVIAIVAGLNRSAT